MTDLNKCPGCGGPADNGHDREMPPNAYLCTGCEARKPLTDADLDWLVKLAGEATPGPWRTYPLDYREVELDRGDNESVCSVKYGGGRPRETAAYIAAASPDVVAGLIGRVREVERQWREATDANARAAGERDAAIRERDELRALCDEAVADFDAIKDAARAAGYDPVEYPDLAALVRAMGSPSLLEE